MYRKAIPGLWLAAAFSVSSCAAPERSPSGFRLPEGDAEAGQTAFLELSAMPATRSGDWIFRDRSRILRCRSPSEEAWTISPRTAGS